MTREKINQKISVTKTSGFTLVELLVVIAIIAVLSAVVMTSINAARIKTRDTVRYSELFQLRTAINRYYTENGAYPDTGSAWLGSEPGGTFPNNNGNWIPGLVTSKMISALPKDPIGGPNPSCAGNPYRSFVYKSDTKSFKLLSYCALEGAYPLSDNPFYDPVRATNAIQVSSDPTTAATW